MKLKYLSILFILSISCSKPISSEKTINIFLGNWLITNVDGVICFSCPEIIFYNDKAGKIKQGNDTTEFLYSYNEDQLLFQIDDNQKFFTNSNFNYELINYENLIKIQFYSKNKEELYEMVREKY